MNRKRKMEKPSQDINFFPYRNNYFYYKFHVNDRSQYYATFENKLSYLFHIFYNCSFICVLWKFYSYRKSEHSKYNASNHDVDHHDHQNIYSLNPKIRQRIPLKYNAFSGKTQYFRIALYSNFQFEFLIRKIR